MKKRIFLTLIIGLLVIISLIASITWSKRQKTKVYGSGMIEVQEVQLSARVGGQIKELNIVEGAEIKEGETLVVLDHQELTIQSKEAAAGVIITEQARAEIRIRKRDLEKNIARSQALHETGDIPDNEYEALQSQLAIILTQETKAEASLKAARARMELIQTQIANMFITAPIAGTILAVNYEKGETVLPGSTLLKIGNLNSAILKIYVAEREIGKIKLGSPALVLVDAYPKELFAGRITWISSEAEFTPKNTQTRDERAQLVFAIKITIDNPRLKLLPGMPADARIIDHDARSN